LVEIGPGRCLSAALSFFKEDHDSLVTRI